ncbi:ornithine cyclodeaminase family protein [Defluviimonas sp. WL0024]|uniref:Ornithine cyclodeaminase family protein n=1 Tax=Albidovulum salinarum TaxID=2984153 RepID=A0ABT2XBC3_9RHOB|nr:ornithine cyclodeaminase family protein [Defluviimonas sp. WL0024]MCU9850342.1 ornithine cyclodeaminase family protein [Defluviimonas sp. WL0024]
MQIFSAEQTRNMLPFDRLIDALREMFVTGAEAPLRHHHTMPLEGQPDATLLLMPAWNPKGLGGVKVVNVNPGNASRGKPALSSAYMLFDAETGRHLALLDGGEITNRRTVAASALAADYLARKDSRTLLIVGAGRVASNLAYAFRAVRKIDDVIVWDVVPEMAERLVAKLADDGFSASRASDLRAAVEAADIISCATLATEPLVLGEWLKPGQHLDLIGSFTPKMRETDDTAMQRASVFIDTDGAFKESGDIILPIQSGALSREAVRGDLFDLCRGKVGGRASPEEITLFKGVGTALEDLAAATLAYSSSQH